MWLEAVTASTTTPDAALAQALDQRQGLEAVAVHRGDALPVGCKGRVARSGRANRAGRDNGRITTLPAIRLRQRVLPGASPRDTSYVKTHGVVLIVTKPRSTTLGTSLQTSRITSGSDTDLLASPIMMDVAVLDRPGAEDRATSGVSRRARRRSAMPVPYPGQGSDAKAPRSTGPLPAGPATALASFAQQVEEAHDWTAVGVLLHDALRHHLGTTRVTAFAAGLPGCPPEARFAAGSEGVAIQTLASAASRCLDERCDVVQPLDRAGFVLACPLATIRGAFGAVVAVVPASPDAAGMALARAFCDVAALSLCRQERERTGRLLTAIIDRGEEAVSLYDASGTILFTNQAYHRIFEHYPDAACLRGMTHEKLYRLDLEAGMIDDPIAKSDPDRYLRDRMRIFETLRTDVHETQTLQGRDYLYTRSRLATGETFSRRIDITAMKAVETRLRASQHRLEEIAYIDLTTGLPNRARFREWLDAEFASGPRPIAVVLVNLDRFKTVNETLGDEAGDALLMQVAGRLGACVRPNDLLARLGGDEFAICCMVERDARGAAMLVDRVKKSLREPFAVGGKTIVMHASIGVACCPAHGTTADSLLKHAGVALGAAKQAGGGQCRHFDADMEAALIDRKMLAFDLREAIALGQLELHYQPLQSLRTGRVEGVEALVRWRHPSRGMIAPSEFIPLAEATGLMVPIGTWVLGRAMSDACLLPADLTVAVNLSTKQIAHSDIVETTVGIARERGFDLRRLELEITESHLLQNDRTGIETLRLLRMRGIGISIDDFGTGYSSLSYLLSFPFTKIKLDKSFVGAMLARSDASAIVSAVVALAERLGMVSTAEGVETVEQMEWLRSIGCGQIQGYVLARPLPLAALQAWLAMRASGAPEAYAGRSAMAATS